jgi:hypothetical protein
MHFPTEWAESNQTVFFESFSPDNFEFAVKMVDGCQLPAGDPLRSYWVFVGGLTNAESDIQIEDTDLARRTKQTSVCELDALAEWAAVQPMAPS